MARDPRVFVFDHISIGVTNLARAEQMRRLQASEHTWLSWPQAVRPLMRFTSPL
jgi:hypothetical protein